MELLDKMRGPLPGKAASNRKFAIEYMRNHGFEVDDNAPTEYPDQKYRYYLRGELVGWSYDNIMYLQPILPSLVNMGILERRNKTEIPFDLPGIEVHNRLQDAVKELKNNMAQYDELVKKSRVQKVREYFKYRNIANQGVKEYNKLMNGLMR